MHRSTLRHLRVGALVCAVLQPGLSLAAAEQAGPPSKLRVCQDPNNMPFSNAAGEGIENRIAELFGAKLGVPVEYFSFPQRLAFVRNTLRYKLPGDDYRCDVILGVPDGFGQVATTNAYYRSTYALVYPKGGKLDGVDSGEAFLARAAQAIGPGRLGIHDKSPAAAWLAKHQLTELAHPYPIMSPDPDYYPGHLLDKDLARGNIDAAIIWGPIAGYFAPRVKDKSLVVVPLASEPGVRFDYGIAMGVRHGEPQWRGQIQRLIDGSLGEITQILHEYGVPLVNDIGDLIKAPVSDAGSGRTGSATSTAAAGTNQAAGSAAAALLEEKRRQVEDAQAAAKRTQAELAQSVAAPAAAPATTPIVTQDKPGASGSAATAMSTAAVAAAGTATAAAASVAPAASAQPGAAAGESPLYQVKDGNLVDANTYEGFKTWRAAACDRCHGANQEGLVGPSLIGSLKTLSKDEFIVTIRDGRLAKGMQSFGNSPIVMNNIDHLYAYLKGRSDGAITQAKVGKITP